MSDPKKLARHYLRHTLCGQPTLDGVRSALEAQGYTLIYFNPQLNDAPTETVIRSLGLEALCRTSRGFTYAGGDYRLVFVHEDLSGQEELLVLLHEQGHILCGHLQTQPVIGLDVQQEFEANEFLHYALQPSCPRRALRFCRAHRLPVLIAAGCVALVLFLGLTLLLIHKSTTVYATATGTRYHTAACGHIDGRSNVRALSRHEAEQASLTPCEHCLSDQRKNLLTIGANTMKNDKTSALPTILRTVGNPAVSDMCVYLDQKVHKTIRHFSKTKTTLESGGVLVGTVVERDDRTHVLVAGFVEAKGAECTASTITFTPDTWSYIHDQMDALYPGKKIVGWLHTQPGLGVLLSESDLQTHATYFNAGTQLAIVVDPVQKDRAMYYVEDGAPVRLPGMHIYDATGQKNAKKATYDPWRDLVVAVLAVCVVFLLFFHQQRGDELAQLKAKVAELESSQGRQDSAIISFGGMVDEVRSLVEDLHNLQEGSLNHNDGQTEEEAP